MDEDEKMDPAAEVKEDQGPLLQQPELNQMAAEIGKRESKQQDYYEQIEVAKELSQETIVALAKEIADLDGESKQAKELKSALESFLRMEYQFRYRSAALKRAKADLLAVKFDAETANFAEILARYQEEEAKKPENAEAEQQHVDKAIKSLTKKVWEMNNKGKPMPGQEDEDMVVVNNEELKGPRKCPLTNDVLENAVKNSECGHSYSEEAVLAYLKNQRKAKKQKAHTPVGCPVAGCKQMLSEETLKPDVAERRAVELRQREQEKEKAKNTGKKGKKGVKEEKASPEEGSVDFTQQP